MNRIIRWVTEAALVAACACAVRADVTASWNQDASGNWSNGGNWSGGSAAVGATGVATFSNAITDNRTVTVDTSPWTINGLLFGSTGTFGWTVAGGILDLAGTAPTITVNPGSNAKVSSTLTGSAGLTKAGAGTLTLSGANAYSGTTTVSAGALQIGDGSSATANAGSGVLAVNGNALNLDLNGAATLVNSSVTSYGLIQNIGSGKVTLTNGVISGTLDGGSAGIVLANLISGQFAPKGDLTFGCASTAWTMWGGYPGTVLHIVNDGTFWWIGGTSAENALTLDIAAGVTVSLHPAQGYNAPLYYILAGPGNFTFDGDANQLAYIFGTSTLGGTLTANRRVSFGNGGATGAAGATRIASTANGPVSFNSTIDNTYSGCMSGAGALIKTNSNTLTLSGANTYSGSTVIGEGTLAIGEAGVLGSGSYAGSIVNNGAFVYDSSADQSLSGVISGTGSLTKTNSGTLTLSGYNTYSGATRVNAGKLVGATGGACLNSQVTVAAGATNGVKIVAYGDHWSCAGMTYAEGVASLEFDLTSLPVSTTLAPLFINGDLNVAGTVEIAVRNGCWPDVGVYPLVSYTGSLLGAGAFSLVSLPAGLSATLVNNTDAKRLDLNVTAIPTAGGTASIWTHLVGGNASGDWGTSDNWSGGVPNATDAIADFSTLDLTSTSYVNNDAPRTVGTLRFADTAASHDWSVANSTLTLATSLGMPTITVNNRQADFSAGLAGAQGFIKDGPGTLRLFGLYGNTFGGQVVVSEGVLYAYKGASLKNTTGSITVLPGATLDIFNDWDGNSLANAVYLCGNGVGVLGALHIWANLTVSGPITLLTDSKIAFENFCTITGPITAAGAGKSLEVGETTFNDPRYSLNIYGSVNLGTGTLTINSVPTGGSETHYVVALNAANTYSGGTVLNNYAVLRLGNPGALGSGGVTLSPTTRLDLYSQSVAISWLSGTGGDITDTHDVPGNSTLTVNQTVDTVYSGAIVNGPNRALSLLKNGGGTLVLSGVNTYTGATAVSGGTLCMNGALGTASLTVGTASAFAAGSVGQVGHVSLPGTLTFQDASRLLVDAHASSADTISASGDVAIGSGVELRVSDDQTSAGSWKVVESVGGTVSGNFVLVGGVNRAKLEKVGSAVWLTIPPKGTLLMLR